MKTFKYVTFFTFLVFLWSCNESLNETIEGSIICDTTEVIVSESDNYVYKTNSEPVQWQGTYTNNIVQISFTESVGTDGETEKMSFVFTKVDDCLQIDYAYKYYYGSYGDISAITQMDLLDVSINEWVKDKNFSGQIVYRDHHDKQIYTHNFWIDFTEDNYQTEKTNYSYFADCFLDDLPIDLDLNNDGNTDYTLTYEETRDTGNTPQYNAYTIKLISTDETINEILSPKNSSIPYPVIFEPPFSSENTKKYDANKFNSADVRNALDVFYEFDAPYEDYNYFLQNNLTNKKEFNNKKDDYYLVRMTFNDNSYYGWIKVDFSATECYIEVLDTYLSPTPNQHVSVEN